MPSSLIIVALAVAWLVVLVPMVARKRQEVARTGDDALASRVVRSGSSYDHELAEWEESGMAETTDDHAPDAELPADDAEFAADERELAPEEREFAVGAREFAADERELAEDDEYAEPAGRYRPGRGGFDPRAAELAARAKYAFRQRVVLALIATVIISAVVAGIVWSALFSLTGAAGFGLVGYLAYLRRQVRIENDIRQRRLARLAGARSAARRRSRDEVLDDEYDRRLERDFDAEYEHERQHAYELADDEPMTLAGVERKPRPKPRQPRRNTVVVDIDDEDPAFHELDEPGRGAYRRAVGE
jgi:hypothetical protein